MTPVPRSGIRPNRRPADRGARGACGGIRCGSRRRERMNAPERTILRNSTCEWPPPAPSTRSTCRSTRSTARWWVCSSGQTGPSAPVSSATSPRSATPGLAGAAHLPPRCPSGVVPAPLSRRHIGSARAPPARRPRAARAPLGRQVGASRIGLFAKAERAQTNIRFPIAPNAIFRLVGHRHSAALRPAMCGSKAVRVAFLVPYILGDGRTTSTDVREYLKSGPHRGAHLGRTTTLSFRLPSAREVVSQGGRTTKSSAGARWGTSPGPRTAGRGRPQRAT